MPLKTMDPHHWGPIPEVVEYVTSLIDPFDRVLEVGPGHAPFKRANMFVDFAPWPIDGVDPEWLFKCDIATEPLPFDDKSFDFIYCRHTLEDMWNPFHLIAEMERVGRAGYIETPSPIAELCRGVDGGAPPYRGYHHHRWVVWDEFDAGLMTVDDRHELRFVSKYPVIEYLDVDDTTLHLGHAPYWNTYLVWEDKIPVKHLQSPLDYDIPRDYRNMLNGAIASSMKSTTRFFKQFKAMAA